MRILIPCKGKKGTILNAKLLRESGCGRTRDRREKLSWVRCQKEAHAICEHVLATYLWKSPEYEQTD